MRKRRRSTRSKTYGTLVQLLSLCATHILNLKRRQHLDDALTYKPVVRSLADSSPPRRRFSTCVEAPMSLRFLSHFAKAHGFFVAALFYAASAGATCSDTRIKNMAQNGQTIAAIAKSCEMDKDEINKVINDEPSSPEASPRDEASKGGLPPGTPVDECECRGQVNLSVRQPLPRCQSGYVLTAVCGGFCPFTGYYQSRRVCTE